MDLNIKRSRDNVLIARIVIIATGEHGKSELAAALARSGALGPKENMYCIGPVRVVPERIGGVKWYDVPVNDREAQERFFSYIIEQSKIPYEEGGHDPILIVDEADSFYSQGGKSYGSPSLKSIVDHGRNWGICQLYISRATSDLAATTLGNANLIFFGRVNSPAGLDWIRRYMRSLPDAERIINNLPPHVFLVWEPNGNPQFRGLAKVNMATGQIETQDLTQPPLEEDEASGSDSDEPETPTSDGNASTLGATGSSRTSSEATSAPSTTPTG